MLPFGDTIEVLRASRDRHGDTVLTSVGVIRGCGVAPASSAEDTEQRAQVDTRITVYAPVTKTAVTAHDRVRFLRPGLTPDEVTALPLWSVDGEPEPWTNPFSRWRPGRVINLRLVTG